MKSVLFVCLGNICRSPMAEVIFKHEIAEAGLDYTCDSAGTSAVHAGEKADSRMRESAKQREYNLEEVRSRQFEKSDFDKFDFILVMDESNYQNIRALSNRDEDIKKVSLITDYCKNESASEVPDPYYGGENGFFEVIDILEDAIRGFISETK
ncbi:low molecular weight protein-tyrosine-phosphatase [Halobacteriovorax sp.]|uniref:low molecular weight protein-tyrosine-phosphatase n=1 Tax=Halobacteriovorax sp. TaxID=2020862 RepID=UPI003568350C